MSRKTAKFSFSKIEIFCMIIVVFTEFYRGLGDGKMGCRIFMIFIERVPLDFICDFSRGEDPFKDGQLANLLII